MVCSVKQSAVPFVTTIRNLIHLELQECPQLLLAAQLQVRTCPRHDEI
jgi:hypothetical protein